MPRPPDFNPRSPHGERRNRRHHSRPPQNFNPRSPHGERLGVTTTQEMLESISIHAPRTGSDRAAGTKRGTSRQFQSTLPARGATGAYFTTAELIDISIHAPRTGSDSACRLPVPQCGISIHAPRTGSDPPFDYNRINAYISIHAPRTGSDVNRFCNRPCINAFQSTLPARGATFQQLMEHNWQIYFNPRSPHGERLAQSIYLSAPVHYFNPRSPHGERRHLRRHRWQAVQISIHAPRTGSDLCPKAARRSGRFQSTLPARGATRAGKGADCDGGDFNPRSPHGERRGDSMADAGVYIISIHAPRTGSDWVAYNVDNEMPISIHAPRTGSDPNARA